MIIWLASYPRSGNTLSRILLTRYFGQQTWSIHGDGNDRDLRADLGEVVGFEPHGSLDDQSIAAMAASSATYIVKTHNLPNRGSDWPVIYIVRDGRSALASYWHYRNRPGEAAPSLEEVVAGMVQFGSWSAHVAAWLDAPLSRRLVLRYEDLAVPTAESLAALGAFVDAAALDIAPPAFDSLHAAAPDFFRGGDDARNIAEIESRCPAMFNLFHGPMQERLGYPLARMRAEPPATLAAELETWLAELAAQRDRITAERNAMRMSRFWRAREAAITMLRGAGLRSQS